MKKLERIRRAYFLVFLVGLFIKYNYLLIEIFMVKNYFVLLGNNLVLLSVMYFFLKPSFGNYKKRNTIFIIAVFFAVLFYANLWYNRYFGNYLSITDIFMGQGTRPIKVISRQLFILSDFLFILDLIMLWYFNLKLKREKYIKKINWHSKPSREQKYGLLLIMILLVSQLSISAFFFSTYKPSEFYSESTSLMANAYGILPLYAYELYLNIKEKPDIDAKEEVVENPERIVEENNKDYHLPEDTNILIIQLESYDAKMVDYKHNGKKISPFISQLKNKALYFDNIYAQHINGSFDAEFAVLTSLYPINKNYSFLNNNMENYNSLVKIFNNINYETLAFHGNDKEFFYRDKGYYELGYDRFYSLEDYSFDDNHYDIESYFGINDYDFFDQSYKWLNMTDEPFFSYFITVTSHTPFNFYPKSRNNDFEDIENQLVKDYFESIRFLDASLEMFFDKLEKDGLLENTMVIIFSDHNADINKEEYLSSGYFESEENIKKPEKTPLFILHPALEPEVINKTGTVTDVAPTALALLGIEKPEEFLGVSLLNKIEKPVYFLHEVPQILYMDQLFLRFSLNVDGEYVFERIANIKGKENLTVKLSETWEDNLNETVDYMHMLIKTYSETVEE
ncbi:MAG TPA: LTA synthase family protein [Clostridia bacterium]|nr:LTA synthase family protein [Clostridia bacterium]